VEVFRACCRSLRLVCRDQMGRGRSTPASASVRLYETTASRARPQFTEAPDERPYMGRGSAHGGYKLSTITPVCCAGGSSSASSSERAHGSGGRRNRYVAILANSLAQGSGPRTRLWLLGKCNL